ncbi:MAG TPA: nickel-dependent hydrogenase large subunit [Planctomycetota bacterium]|nr:nickel-dependent hydrogenase large subunit [Planctomycetota bacterium]HRR81341.1 nickel-dependent hydrogenase large subunit [Planctomycetota bacterium]HRT95355.1 nickel-dependent hydrogenase large subunit [Planctomycetota bacterium]
MRRTINVGPVTRVEGHLDIEVTVDTVNGQDRVVDAKSSGTMLRAFELILLGRDPFDAPHYTQRICGVCPISHSMASVLSLEAIFGVAPTDNGRILRNLVLGANFLQSHILHFYHLAALDYIDTAGLIDMAPWMPRYASRDLLRGADAARLVGHYVDALAMRRKAHTMGAIFGGKLPIAVTFLPGGSSETVTVQKIADFRKLLDDLRAFIQDVYLPDLLLVATRFPEYAGIGRGCGNLVAYGVFDLDAAGASKLLPRGTLTDGRLGPLDPASVAEYVRFAWYDNKTTGANPAAGVTRPTAKGKEAYSWVKAPRYAKKVHEVGPLARMWMSGDYRNGISVLDRLAARAYEAEKVAIAMNGWLNELVPGGPTQAPTSAVRNGAGIGLTEAPRGALGHWTRVTSGKLSHYQIITPTAWNASPRDDGGQLGAIEQALINTPVADTTEPLEVLRVVHSFDPCLSCAVHMARPGKPLHTIVLSA